MGSHLTKESSHPQKMTRRTSRRRMGKTLHQLKESCAMNVIGMDISRKNVQTISKERVKCLESILVIKKAQIPMQKENVIVRETIQLSWQLPQ